MSRAIFLPAKSIFNRRTLQLAWFFLTLIVGYFTYFRHYEQPPALYWDENYHIAAAQKYLHSVFFMEPHPPLGKLLIALGEKLVAPNFETDQFLTTDHARDIPQGFSFAGYRFFPALFAWLSAGILFLLFLEITASGCKSFLFCTPYLFDNALIVHSRGAMLEGPQLFFVILFLLFLCRWLSQSAGKIDLLLLGCAMGAALSIKINSAFLIVLPMIGWWFSRSNFKNALGQMLCVYTSAALIITIVWLIHFNLGQNIVKELPNEGFYNASEEYKSNLRNGSRADFLTALADNIGYARQYTAGVPSLDLCKPGENGSQPIFWPVGGSSILYRWDRLNDSVRYLYLQSNPVGWLLALAAVVVVTARTVVWSTQGRSGSLPQPTALALTLVSGYLGYMFTVLSVSRVLYLYHYFMPLVLGYVLLPIALQSISAIGGVELNSKLRWLAGLIGVVFIFTSFAFFSPFTYYMPLSSDQFHSRELFSVWRLHRVDGG